MTVWVSTAGRPGSGAGLRARKLCEPPSTTNCATSCASPLSVALRSRLVAGGSLSLVWLHGIRHTLGLECGNGRALLSAGALAARCNRAAVWLT